MAMLQQVKTTCDLHEHPEHEEIDTVEFSVDGVDYVIDLCKPEATKLRDALKRHAEAGRRAKPKPLESIINTKPRRGEASAKAKQQREYLTAVRVWARNNGFDVSDHGRVAQRFIDAYENREVPAQQPAAEQPAAEHHHQADQQPAEHHQAEQAEHQQADYAAVPEQRTQAEPAGEPRKPLFAGIFSG